MKRPKARGTWWCGLVCCLCLAGSAFGGHSQDPGPPRARPVHAIRLLADHRVPPPASYLQSLVGSRGRMIQVAIVAVALGIFILVRK